MGFHKSKWNRTLNVSYNFIGFGFIVKRLFELLVFSFSSFSFFFFVLHLLPFAKCTPVMHRSHLYLQNRCPGH